MKMVLRYEQLFHKSVRRCKQMTPGRESVVVVLWVVVVWRNIVCADGLVDYLLPRLLLMDQVGVNVFLLFWWPHNTTILLLMNDWRKY